jgi:hypothetical protein
MKLLVKRGWKSVSIKVAERLLATVGTWSSV